MSGRENLGHPKSWGYGATWWVKALLMKLAIFLNDYGENLNFTLYCLVI